MYILNKCVDHSRLQKGQTVQHLCNKLSADETPGSCISLMPYISKFKLVRFIIILYKVVQSFINRLLFLDMNKYF